jgi:signal transduction histidine kinase/ActR/RegA family two-component response regulator
MARILVVDDQKISRLTLAGILGDAGHDVRVEGEGRAGIETARSWLPDVIVLDVHMPGMDGFGVVERLKADTRTEAIPVVFLTGEPPTDQLIVRGLDLGAYDFLSKGCSKAELLARVSVMERIKRGHDELAAIARISDALLQSTDPEELGQQFVREVAHVFRAAVVGLSIEREGHARLHVSRGLEEEDDGAVARTLPAVVALMPDGAGAVSVVLKPAEIADAVAPYLGRSLRSGTAARVRRGPSSATVVVLGEGEDAYRRDVDGPLLKNLVSQAALAIEHAFLSERSREQARDLERAMEQRSRFFASLSHELRTPINAVIGYNHLLGEEIFGPLNAAQSEALGKANRSAQHLLELVDDILDVSKIEAGKLEILPEEVDLAALLRDTATSVQLQARKKGIALEIEAPDTAVVTTDPARVRQIVLNLLSNAVKFTAEGGVDLRLARDGGSSYTVTVTDTGPGIPAEDRERIFEEFEQGSAREGTTGTGLGLAISRRLAELLGGDLQVESEVGVGSTFVLTLPVATPRAELAPASDESGANTVH